MNSFYRCCMVAWACAAAVYCKCLFRCGGRSEELCYSEYLKSGNCQLRDKCCAEVVTVTTRCIKRGIQQKDGNSVQFRVLLAERAANYGSSFISSDLTHAKNGKF